jgi:hypothetical protein
VFLTWNKSETKEIVRLGVKFGKTIPSQNKRPTLNEANFHPKWVAPNPICLETWVMPPPWCRHVKEDICIINSDDDFSLTPHKNKVTNQVGLNSPFLRTILMCNMLPRRSQKFLPKLKLPHHSLVPSRLQICLLQIHNEIWQIWTKLKWKQGHWPL